MIPSYPAYKPSGIPWLGDIPAHWETERAKWLFHRMQRPVRPQDETVTCFRDGIVTLRKNRRTSGFTESLKEIGYQGVRVGDLVIHAMDAFAGATGVSDSEGKATPVYAVCQPNEGVNAYFYAHIVREMARTQWILALARGIRERSTDFRYETFASQTVPLPPLPEQTAIARYLDHVDRRLRRALRARRRLIELLTEQKQAIIHQAVTGQIDVRSGRPYPAYKDSGVEWLGDLPEHWEVRRLGNVTEMRVSNVDKHTHEDEIPVRLCNYVDVYKNDRITDRISFMRATATQDEIERFQLKSKDVLITKDSEAWDDIGVPALVEYVEPDLVCGYHLALLRPYQSLMVGEYLLRALQCRPITYQFHVAANGITRYGLSQNGIKTAKVLLPPLPEQTAIARFLDEVTANITTAIARTQREIDLLREYRTRLIADVVTGKVDVRAAAAQLAEAGEEEGDGEEAWAEEDGGEEREGEEGEEMEEEG